METTGKKQAGADGVASNTELPDYLELVQQALLKLVNQPWEEQKKELARLKSAQKTYNSHDLKRMMREIEEKQRNVDAPNKNDIRRILGKTFAREKDGTLVMVNYDQKGIARTTSIANGYLEIVESVLIESPTRDIHQLKGLLHVSERTFTLECPYERLSSNAAFSEELHKAAGHHFLFIDASLSDLRLYTKAISRPKTTRVSQNFGWNDDTYLTPTLAITRDEILANTVKTIQMPEVSMA